MTHLINKRSKKTGLIPGTLVYVGDETPKKAVITIFDYDENTFQEKKIKNIEECFPFKETPTVTWINIDGLGDPDIVEKIGSQFDIHSLTLEDILSTGQRPKLEDFDKYLFIVLRMLCKDKDNGVRSEQVSMLLGKNFVISFQEQEGDLFDAVRDRIRTAKGRVRKMGPDYLAYSLLDAVIDGYFSILENIGDKIEVIEEKLVAEPTPKTLRTIHDIKRDTIFLRKSVWPLREVVGGLSRGESSLIKETTKIFLRDIYDHTIQVIDSIETFRDMASGILDIYLSSLSNRMNEVMKVLTIIATIFIPITFIAGVYGMNFKFMPELGWKWGYFGVLGLMALVVAGMLVYFRRKKWL